MGLGVTCIMKYKLTYQPSLSQGKRVDTVLTILGTFLFLISVLVLMEMKLLTFLVEFCG